MPLTWRLPIYAFDEATKNRMRLIAMQIDRDPNVESFSLTQDPDEATKHWLTVEFREGALQPATLALRYLDRYLKPLRPEGALPEITPAPGPPTRWERLRADALDINDADGV